jgi:RND family efflux transporter MFP subunit
VPRVTVAHPTERQLTDEVEFGGWLAPSATVEVRARVRGHIDKVNFIDGDIVKKGAVLFILDPRPFQAQIEQSKAQIRAFEAQKLAAEKDVARYTALLQSGGATKQQLEKAEADVKVYDAQAATQVEVMREQQLNLEFSQVTSPIEGRIGRALLTDGNLVNAGGSDPLLTTIVAISPIYVYFNVDERTLQRWQKLARADGQTTAQRSSVREQKIPIRFGLDTDEGVPHEAVIDFADNKVDSTTGTVEVRGVIDNADRKFVPGERVQVRVGMGEPYRGLLVPDTAVLSDQEKKYVLVLDKDHKVLRRDIQPGRLLDDGNRVVLSTGGEPLTASDWIITLGLQRARVNDPVEPFDADGKPIGAAANKAAEPEPAN